MPTIRVVFYQEATGHSPVVGWLRELRATDQQAFAKCVARIRLLADFGYELRRPVADFLRDGVYELRVRHMRRNFRLLYFFHGTKLAVVATGLTKERSIPNAEIERTIILKKNFEKNPATHTYDASKGDKSN